jgi:transposase-like protein
MFKVNDEFETYGEFNEKVEKWTRENFFMVRKEDSHKILESTLARTIVYQRLTLKCIHAGSARAPKESGKRKNTQSYLGKACELKIRLSYNRTLKK